MAAATELIHPGDKVEIRLLQEVRQIGRSGEDVKLYISKVQDIWEDGSIEMSLPSEGGKLVTLQQGVRYDMIFSSRSGMCQAVGQIKGRYKTGNLYLMSVELLTQPERFQRREFFRYSCSLRVFYYLITEEEANLESGNAVFIQVRSQEREEFTGRFADLSGGGGRLVTEREVEADQFVLIGTHLKSETIDKDFYLVAKVLESLPLKDGGNKFQAHTKFLFKDNKVREEIVKYIFEKERMDRQKGRA